MSEVLQPRDVRRNVARMEPTAPGAYRYVLHSEQAGADRVQTQAIELRALEAEKIRDDLAQLHRFRFADGDTVEFGYLWRDGSIAVTLERRGEFECTFDPPPATLLLPIKVGARWSATTRCAEGSRPERIYEGEVLRAEARPVDGTRVETFVLRKRIREGDTVLDEQLQWFSPAHRLVVRLERTAGGLFSIQELQNLEPA